METRADIENEIVSRLSIGSNSNTYSAARITQVVRDSHFWATQLFFWSPLTKVKKTTAQANSQGLIYDYYDYPTEFLNNTISRLEIDGKRYDRKAYLDLLDYVNASNEFADPPDPTKRYFANYGRRFFVWPSYTGIAPAGNLVAWGQIQAADLTSPLSTTIFTYMEDSGNEAIVKKSLAVLWKRVEPALAAAEETEAIQLLKILWDKESKANQRDQRLDHPMFDVPDFFSGGLSGSNIGKFNIDVVS